MLECSDVTRHSFSHYIRCTHVSLFSAGDGKAYTLTKWSDVKEFMKKKDA